MTSPRRRSNPAQARAQHVPQKYLRRQRILAKGLIPRELIAAFRPFRPELAGVKVPRQLHVHVNGTDLIRDR